MVFSVKHGGYGMRPTVTCYIPTKDRYYSTLPLALMAVSMQTVKPDRLVIYDDGEQKDLREVPLYQNIFFILMDKGIKWEVLFGKRRGQVNLHQDAVDKCTTEWLWRLDDDNYPEPDCLEILLECASTNQSIGAVGGTVLHRNYSKNVVMESGRIEDVLTYANVQWSPHKDIIKVDHLYSTFIYRKEAAKHGYCSLLSPVGHREETLFTYEMKRNGWQLLVEPKAVTWHLRDDQGGIRSAEYNGKQELWSYDEKIFRNKMDSFGINFTQTKLIVLDNGLGDHLCFKSILPEIREKYKDLVLAVCYPEVFKNDDIKLISIADAKNMGDITQYNVYKFLWDTTPRRYTLQEAFRRLYLG
jgi:hypothetical protein